MNDSRSVPDPASCDHDLASSSWNAIREALRDLEFGSVTLIVQDGVLVQIERTERRRFRRPTRTS